jgi:hypothetical protein
MAPIRHAIDLLVWVLSECDTIRGFVIFIPQKGFRTEHIYTPKTYQIHFTTSDSACDLAAHDHTCTACLYIETTQKRNIS